MTTVVSDTSPLNYLILIAAVEVLPRLFDQILIPPGVFAELQHPRTPVPVFHWASSLPSWAKVQAPTYIDPTISLGTGETEAICLAVELKIPAILIDERKGRLAAEMRGIVPVGTLNILYTSHLRGLLDFEATIDRLRQTSFHLEPAIIEELIRKVRAR